MQPQWYKNTSIYAIDVGTFSDRNGDGWGDLAGVTERLDYVRGLGVSCIWLLPFYPSPFRDNGYDISDYLSVDPRFGDLADMSELLDAAEQRGIRVIVDLVCQHTSIDHPWFQEAVADRDSPYRDYYVWADEPHETDVKPVFPGEEDSVWTYHEQAGQYYRHVFYAHEPDLNTANPRVRHEIRRIMQFWMRLGVCGFRIDALPYMVKLAAKDDPTDNGHWFLRELREFVALRRPDAVLLAETDIAPGQYAEYFGSGAGDEMNMLFNFYVNNYYFLALARQKAEPILRALDQMPSAPRLGQYGTFGRNHDELDLGRLSDDERAEVLQAFGPEQDMQIYGRGIRRRLAPMLDDDQRRLISAFSVWFSLPGSPVIYYGEEIGMGDDLSLPDRKPVRTPMQWSAQPNGGFSHARREDLVMPPLSGGVYGYERLNVHAQTMHTGSLLNTVGRMIRTRIGLNEIATGECRPLKVDSDQVLALCYVTEDSNLVMVSNLAPGPVTVSLPDQPEVHDLVDVFGDANYAGPSGNPPELELGGYGFRWLQTRAHLVE